MDHHFSSSPASEPENTAIDAVLCLIQTASDLRAFAAEPDALEKIGFTGIVLPPDMESDSAEAIDAIRQHGLTVHNTAGSSVDLSVWTTGKPHSASDMWIKLNESPEFSLGVDLDARDEPTRRKSEVATLLQISMRPVPIVPASGQLVYSTSHLEQRQLLRSEIFWRNRNNISGFVPNLVHAGEDGLLIYTIDSWLVALNQNPDEASIDLGQSGTMWLMLGTQRDVLLHGSLLILPGYSGAIMANELAR